MTQSLLSLSTFATCALLSAAAIAHTPHDGSGAAHAHSYPTAPLVNVASPAPTTKLPKVEGAWVRSTVTGQSGSAAYMKITAAEPMQLVSVTTPLAGTADVHEMKMEGDVMRMRSLPRLDLPAGRTIELKPGGYHLMLQELKQPLTVGSTVPLTLVLRDAKGVESKLDLKLPVAAAAPSAGAEPASSPKH
jgi:periplasmic copper chaperone A